MSMDSKVRAARPSTRARMRSLRRSNVCPQRSGAGSVNALNSGRSVWNCPAPSTSSGSSENASGLASQASSYSNDPLSRPERARAHSRPTRTQPSIAR